MLLKLIEAEYLPALDALSGDREFGAFVDRLGTVIAERYHAVDTSPLLLDRLAHWPGLGERQRSAFVAMRRAVQLRALPFDRVTDLLCITGPAPAPAAAAATAGPHRRHWRTALPLHVATVAGENDADAVFYRWLAAAWSHRLLPHSGRAGLEVRLAPRGLGGSTAAVELKRAALGSSPLLCVLDSDLDVPGTAPRKKSTAGKALEAHAKLPVDGAPVAVDVLDARDLENLLPLGLLEQIAEREEEWLEPMRTRGFFTRPESELSPAHRYTDIGERQCRPRLLHGATGAVRAQREALLADLATRDPNVHHIGTCQADAEHAPCGGWSAAKAAWGAVPDECVLVHAVGKKVLRRAADWLNANPRDAASRLHAWLPRTDEALLAPARRCWSWGLALPPGIL